MQPGAAGRAFRSLVRLPLLVALIGRFALALHEPVPTLIGLTPTSGPAAGGTVLTISGAGLSRGLPHVCKFGHGSLTASGRFRGRTSHGIVTCVAPPATAGYEATVEVSADGGTTYTSDGLSFRFYHEAVVSASSPSSGPAAGGTLVSVT